MNSIEFKEFTEKFKKNIFFSISLTKFFDISFIFCLFFILISDIIKGSFMVIACCISCVFVMMIALKYMICGFKIAGLYKKDNSKILLEMNNKTKNDLNFFDNVFMIIKLLPFVANDNSDSILMNSFLKNQKKLDNIIKTKKKLRYFSYIFFIFSIVLYFLCEFLNLEYYWYPVIMFIQILILILNFSFNIRNHKK